MKLNRYTSPYSIKLEGNEIRVFNKMGIAITEPLKIKRLGDLILSKLAHSRDAIIRNEKGEVTELFMYENDIDTENPEYLVRLRLLGNLSVDQLK